MNIATIKEKILDKIETQALEDESLGQDWYDQQVSRLESWLDPNAPEWKYSIDGNMSKRFFENHPHPFFVERENTRLQAIKRELSDHLFVKMHTTSRGGAHEAYETFIKRLNDIHYAEGLFYREEHFPAKAENIIAGMVEEIKESYEQSLRFLEEYRDLYEDGDASTRRDIFRELAGSFSETVQSHHSSSMESGLGRGKGYSYDEQVVRHEVPREIRESKDFSALYRWAKEYYKQAIQFLKEI